MDILDWVTLPQKVHIYSLRVLLDPILLLDAQGVAVVRSGFYQLWPIHHLQPFLEKEVLTTITHALATSRLGYYNALWGAGDALGNSTELQLVQNEAGQMML